MLLATKIVAVVLVCVEIDAVQHKIYQQTGWWSPRMGQRALLKEESEATEEVKGGQRQTLGNNYYPGGNGYNYVRVGASGEAEVAFKLDLSLFLEKLDMIPQLQQIILNLSEKVDTLIYNSQAGGGGAGLSAQIIALEQSIIVRIDQQDMKITALYEMIQQFQVELGTINQEIMKILSILSGGGGGGGGGGSGGICAQDMIVIEGLIQQMANMLTRVVQIIEGQGSGQGTVTTSIMEIVQQNYRLLQQCITLIEQIGQQVGQIGSLCPPPNGSGNVAELEMLQEISLVIALIEKVPQQILVVLQNSGLLGGSNGALIQYLQQILQVCESIRNQVIAVEYALGDSSKEMRKYFAENAKSLVAVKKVVTETTEIVQSSAAAAISASRSLKCPSSKNQRPDLDDP